MPSTLPSIRSWARIELTTTSTMRSFFSSRTPRMTAMPKISTTKYMAKPIA